MIVWLAIGACDYRSEFDLVGAEPAPQSPTADFVDPHGTTPPDVGCTSRTIGPDGGTIDAGTAALTVAPRTFGASVEVVELCRTTAPDGLAPLSDGWEIRVAPNAAFLAPMSLAIEARTADPATAVFVPGPDGLPVRSVLAANTGNDWWTAPTWRPGVVALAVDVRILAPFTPQATTADVLLLVDNSCSMLDEQEKLANRLPAHFLDVMEAGSVDYRLGVVSTDNEDPAEMGQLASTGLDRWVEPTTPGRDDVLGELVRVGNQGSPYEQGLATVSTALSRHEDFFRDDASLVVIAVTHRDDYSPLSAEDVAQQMLTLLATRPSVAFDSLVETTGDNRGSKYIALTEIVGGYVTDLGGPGWDRFFEGIAQDLAGFGGMNLGTTDAPEVWWTLPGAEPARVADGDVLFEDGVLVGVAEVPPGAEVWVLYAP